MLIGEKIKMLRKERSWTLAILAEKTGLSISYLSDIERGKTNPSVLTLRNIARVFDISSSSIFGDEYEILCPDYIDEFIEANQLDDSWANLFRALQVGGDYPKKENLTESYLYLKRLFGC